MSQTRVTRTELLGSIWTDVAAIIIGDPCQLITDEAQYEAFCELGCEETEGPMSIGSRTVMAPKIVFHDVIKQAGRHGQPAAIGIRTGADGWYAVYLERDQADGRPLRLVIDLEGKVEPTQGGDGQ